MHTRDISLVVNRSVSTHGEKKTYKPRRLSLAQLIQISGLGRECRCADCFLFVWPFMCALRESQIGTQRDCRTTKPSNEYKLFCCNLRIFSTSTSSIVYSFALLWDWKSKTLIFKKCLQISLFSFLQKSFTDWASPDWKLHSTQFPLCTKRKWWNEKMRNSIYEEFSIIGCKNKESFLASMLKASISITGKYWSKIQSSIGWSAHEVRHFFSTLLVEK